MHTDVDSQFHVGEQVTYIDTEKKLVTSTKGQYEYDICVIATGSDAGMPPYCDTERGRRTKGVFVYRNIGEDIPVFSHGYPAHAWT